MNGVKQPSLLFLVNVLNEIKEISFILQNEADGIVLRFPNTFDRRLERGVLRLFSNTSLGFFDSRPMDHLKKILLNQFFLQKEMEEAIREGDPDQKHLFTRLFRYSSKICLTLAYSSDILFQREQLIQALHALLPGMSEISGSFYEWRHPEMPYLFCYFEAVKLRGKEVSASELRQMENSLRELLLSIPPLTPAVFWPYNKEESYRQLQILKKEIRNPKEKPQISIYFQEQSPSFLKFIFHLARPESADTLEKEMKKLPFPLFCHFQKKFLSPFPIEVGAFSIQIPSSVFNVRESINLLYARRFVLKYIETIVGPYRDYNGGLLEKQQEHFETIRLHLSGKIPHFDLFAEKIFYALHSMEKWFSFSLEETESLFLAFSELIQTKEPMAIRKRPYSFTLLKTPCDADLLHLSQLHGDHSGASQAQISFGGSHFLCLLGPEISHLETLFHTSITPKKTLRLIFQEGPPPSLNPYFSSGDLRCKIVSKLLFEGLTRLTEEGKPELAGALSWKMNPSETVYTFKLRNFSWSNGEKVTAADYAYGWRRALCDSLHHPETLFIIKNGRLFREKKCSAEEVGLRILDPMTLQVELEKPDPRFLYQLAQPSFFPFFGSSSEPKWFNGPFLLRERKEERLLLEKNPYFWNKPTPYFDWIDIRWVDEIETVYSQFIQGETDWIGDPLSILSNEISARLPDLKKRKAKRNFLLYFNVKHPLLSSPKIRKALSLAIDSEKICSEIYPDSSPILRANDEDPKTLFETGLLELGMKREPLTFTYYRRDQLALYLQKTWREKLDFEIRLEGLAWNHFRSRVEKGAFEICAILQDTVEEGSSDWLKRFEGKNSWNFSSWNHSQFAQLVESEKEKAKKILVEEAPFTPLFQYTHLYSHSAGLKGMIFDPEGCIDFSKTFF